MEQLKEDLSGMPFTMVGKKYGVSDNAIRKWLSDYGLSKEEIKSMSCYRQRKLDKTL